MPTMRPTLLELVQNILSAMNSDEVNSIGDTAESLQVAEAIKQTYWNMLGRYDLPEHNRLFQLDSSTDPTTPCIMFRPEGCTRIEWIKYFDTNPADSAGVTQPGFSHSLNVNLQSSFWQTTSSTTMTVGTGVQTFTVADSTLNTSTGEQVTIQSGINSMTGTLTSYIGTTMVINVVSTQGSGTFSLWTVFTGSPAQAPGYKPVRIMPIDEFLHQNSMITLSSDVGIQNIGISDPATSQINTFQFRFRTDRQPSVCSIFSNNYIIFDSYDITQDTTLQRSKTMVWGWIYPTFTMDDNFVPDLDAQQFPLLLNDAKALVFFEQKQFPHMKAEEEVGRQLVSLQKWKAIAGRVSDERDMYFRELPSFGR